MIHARTVTYPDAHSFAHSHAYVHVVLLNCASFFKKDFSEVRYGSRPSLALGKLVSTCSAVNSGAILRGKSREALAQPQ